MAAARDLTASGEGDSLPRLAMARLTMPLRSPSLAGRSNNTVSTLALTRCAAICAPMTPAPRTATLRTFRLLDMWGGTPLLRLIGSCESDKSGTGWVIAIKRFRARAGPPPRTGSGLAHYVDRKSVG